MERLNASKIKAMLAKENIDVELEMAEEILVLMRHFSKIVVRSYLEETTKNRYSIAGDKINENSSGKHYER